MAQRDSSIALSILVVAIGASVGCGSGDKPAAAYDDARAEQARKAPPTTGPIGRYVFYPVGGGGGVLLDTSTGQMWRLVGEALAPIQQYLSTDPNAGTPVDPKDPLGIR